MNSTPIDFVIPWVDGNDPEWQREKQKHHPRRNEDASAIRYRDWGLLKYWFRGVDTFAPWVRKIHFITCGHLPPWLNTDHPKLHVVLHTDYLPPSCLPTFNVNPIELNMHRIEGLSEHFVYFNDDCFLLQPIRPTLFFQKGLPCDNPILSPAIVSGMQDVGYIALNNMGVINTHFSKKEVFQKHPGQWLSPRYGRQLLRTLCLMPWRHFPGFFNDHIPQPFRKETFEQVWAAVPELLTEVTGHRFRDYHGDVNQWLMRYWQFCTGQFVSISPRRGKDLSITEDSTPEQIRAQRYAMICINDAEDIEDFDALQRRLEEVFQSILPTPCSFEKGNAQ